MDLNIDEYEAGNGITFTNNNITNKITISADSQLPNQTNNSGKFLTTDGTSISWSTPVNTVTTATSTGDGNAVTEISAVNGALTVTKGSTFSLSTHNHDGVYANASHNQASNTINVMTGYEKPSSSSAITTSDSLNTAIGKLEKALDLKQNTGSTVSDSSKLGGVSAESYAQLASPALTGTPTAPTATAGTNSTQIATTAYVDGAISDLVNGAPTTLDTLKEIADVLNDSSTGIGAVNTALGGKLNTNITTTGNGNAITDISDSNGNVTATKGSTFSLSTHNHDSAYTAKSASKGSATKGIYTDSNGAIQEMTYSLNKDVPSDAVFTDTTYSNFVGSGSTAAAGLVPAPSTTAGTTKYLREDGSWEVPPNDNTVTTINSTVTGSGNAITDITASNGVLTLTKGSTFSVDGHTHSDYAPISSPSFTGTPTIESSPASTDNTTKVATTAYVNNRLGIPIEKVTALTSSSNITINPANGSLFTLTLGTNATITLSSISNGYYTTNGAVITLLMPATNYAITWTNVTWDGGTAPDNLGDGFNIITFVTADGGTTWYGNALSLSSS